MSHKLNSIVVIGIDIGKNSFHIVGQDRRSAKIGVEPWCCARSGRVARWKRGLPTCHRASSAWRPAPGRITSVVNFRRLATTRG
jgi:hypothetical protein